MLLKVFSTLDPLARRNLLILFGAGLLFWSSLASLLPTLSLYIKDAGATKHQVGIVMGSFAVGLLLFRPWLGQLADKRGRKIVLLIGLTVVAIAPLGYLLTQSIPWLIGIRIFHGLSIAAFTTAYSALVVDLSPERHRGEIIGYTSLVNPIGMALGPAIGGFVQEWIGYSPLFLLSAGAGLAGLCFGLGLNIPMSPPFEQTTETNSPTPFWSLILSSRFRIPTLTLLMVGLAFGVLSTFVPLYIKEIGINFNAGLFYAAAAIASFMIRLPTGRSSDRHGRGRFISVSLIFYAAAMLILWTAKNSQAFVVAGILEGIGSGLFIPMTIALLADRSEPQERGRVFGLCMAGFDLGLAIAGPTLGYFADQIGYRGMFGLSSGLVLIAFVIFVTQCCKDLPHSLGFALANSKDLYAVRHSAKISAN